MMPDYLKCFGTTRSLLLEPAPVLVDVTHAHIPNFAFFEFDKNCLTNPCDGSKIWFRSGNNIHSLVFNSWVGLDRIKFDTVIGAADPGPDLTSFVTPPMDIFGIDGFPAAAWTDFPVIRQP